MIDAATLAHNLESVRSRMQAAADLAGRKDRVALVVVTKGHPLEAIRNLVSWGETEIGESYIEEALAKQEALRDSSINWHMIGHVQSRKAEETARNFSLIHSLDSLKLARRLDRFAGQVGNVIDALLELKVSGETTKHGWPAKDDHAFLANLPEIEQVLRLPNLKVHGLMCIAPMMDASTQALPYFERTRRYRDVLAGRYPDSDWSQLSMGMSDDFVEAIKEGSTMVRIGTAILGPRTV
jgi:pyridoxal phosphate enzyme (YggS family)